METGSDPGFLGFLSAAAGRHLEQQKKNIIIKEQTEF